MNWTAQQSDALKAIAAWLADPNGAQVFRLFGFAGTGKTTIAKELRGMVGGEVCYAAYTGKAALVLQNKGCDGASTLHRLIYKVEGGGGGALRFVLNPESRLEYAALLVVDECSMVGDRLARDVKSFGCRILVIGDPAQLPPVKDAGALTTGEPDFMLTEIHRQAEGNPIIKMSMDIRAGKRLAIGSYGEGCAVIERGSMGFDEILTAHNQALTGRNVTRRDFNRCARKRFGFSGALPVIGDRLVCLRNNYETGLLNGSIWSVNDVGDAGSISMPITVSGDWVVSTSALVAPFLNAVEERDELPWSVRCRHDEFDYAYALTCHKSQGSQWDAVYVVDESGVFREDARRWLYTAVTRAARRVTISV